MYLQLCGSILGNNSFFHVMISDGDNLVLRSHFSLEKWHYVTSSFTLLPYFCVFLFCFVVVLGRAITRNSNPWILKKKKICLLILKSFPFQKLDTRGAVWGFSLLLLRCHQMELTSGCYTVLCHCAYAQNLLTAKLHTQTGLES